MSPPAPSEMRRAAAVTLLRDLRRISAGNGVRHSGIAFDIGLLLYEQRAEALGVGRISTVTGYSGPTIRLVLGRLMEAGVVAEHGRDGKTLTYALTEAGIAGFDRYVEAAWGFAGRASQLSAAADPGPVADPREGPLPPRVRYAAARPVPAGAE